MSSKRRVMTEKSANEPVSKRTRNSEPSEASKTSSSESDTPASKPSEKQSTKPSPKSSASSSSQAIRYSNPNTLSNKPSYVNLEWPNIVDFIDDENQDMPKENQLLDEFCDRVSDLGFPVSEEGAKLTQYLDKEVEKRDQDRLGMHIYNDWNGWGMSETFINYLKEFNKNIFKKTVSPFEKWAYVEGLACYLKGEDNLFQWLNNEDGDSVKEIAAMMGLMVLTAYSALSEHSLFKPDSEVKNIGIMSLLMLEFALGQGTDLDIGWSCEIVRMCDEAGIDLDEIVRKQVSVSKKELKEMRDMYKEKKDGYKAAAEIKSWKPANDVGGEYDDKLWHRWDWKLEWTEFQKDHKGGNHYDLTKGSKKDRKAYTLGTKEFSERIGIDFESE